MLALPGALLITPRVFHDERGFFKETFSRRAYEQAGVGVEFVQDNVSFSKRGVLRGMHFDPRMAKLVQCLQGEIYDVIADPRRDSPTFGRWCAVELSAQNHCQLFVPAGLAHGFYVRSEWAMLHYKQSALYDPACERAFGWNDPAFGIEWPLAGKEPILSAKDAQQ